MMMTERPRTVPIQHSIENIERGDIGPCLHSGTKHYEIYIQIHFSRIASNNPVRDRPSVACRAHQL
jgi:hypothetical protein